MAMIKILEYPDPKLSRVGIEVTEFNDAIRRVIDDMFETHYNTDNCAALAATQLDLTPPWRITVIDFSPNKDQPLCLVNPVLIETSGEQFEYEGCMSVFPDHLNERLKRAQKIKVRAQDRHGEFFEMEAEGFMAKCIQHEMDHLDGTLYIDRLSKMKKGLLQTKIKKIKRAIKNEE